MRVLIHYTTQISVFNKFEQDDYVFVQKERLIEIENFYNKYKQTQDIFVFIICFNDKSKIHYNMGKICINLDDKFCYKKISSDMKYRLLEDIGLGNINTYENGIYYKEFTVSDDKKFYKKYINSYADKIKLKYYEWEELIPKCDILISELMSMIFNERNVLKIATTYSPDIKYSAEDLKIKYKEALISIGFMAKNGIDVSNKTLHGDIGEFLMHVLISDFIAEEGKKGYMYPKLVFKTNPLMSVFGNDGTLYFPKSKEIYYMEAKFYATLNEALNKAVSSLVKHNETNQEYISHRAELFRDIETEKQFEIVKITSDIKESLILFLMCSDKYKEDDIRKCIEFNKKIESLRNLHEVIIFILPIIDKNKFLSFFESIASKEWERLCGN